MLNSRVSIIIPVYNGEHYLKETIDSCVNQTYDNLEIIVIDDHSTDTSKEIINSYRNDNLIKLFNETNLGFNRSANLGINSSRGEFLLVLGQDDVLPNEHVKTMVNEFEEGIVLIYCNSIVIDGNGNPIRLTYQEDTRSSIKNLKYEISKGNIISSTGLIMRKSACLSVEGYTTEFKNYGEWLLWLSMLTQGEIKYLPIKVFYRVHETNISHTFDDIKYKKNLNEYFKYCRHYAISKFFLGFTLKEKISFLLFLINAKEKSQRVCGFFLRPFYKIVRLLKKALG